MNQPNDDFGNGQIGGSPDFTAPVYSYMEGYGDVTASFERGASDGQTLLADGHVQTRSQFDGNPGNPLLSSDRLGD